MKTTKVVLVLAALAIFAAGLFIVVKSRSMSSWKTLSSAAYEVKIPDGWAIYHDPSSGGIIDGDCVSCLIHKPGKRVTVLTGYGVTITKDRLSSFLFVSEDTSNAEADFFKGYDKVGSIKAKNATGNKYYKKITEQKEMSFSPGTQLYGYAGLGETFANQTFNFECGA